MKDSSFCTNSSLDGADYDEEIIPIEKRNTPNRDKTPHNNKVNLKIQNSNKLENKDTKKEKSVNKNEVVKTQTQPQSFQDWAHDLRTPV